MTLLKRLNEMEHACEFMNCDPGSYMTGLACINEKLIMRAQSILREVYHLSEEDSARILHANDLDLKRTIGLLENDSRSEF